MKGAGNGESVWGDTYDAAEDELLVDGAHDASPAELPRHSGGVQMSVLDDRGGSIVL